MNILFMQNGLPRNGLVALYDPWRDTYGRNILPVGSEDFVTEWSANGGETITVTDYPTTINGQAVIAKRIKGTGNGTAIKKYICTIAGLSNPHTSAISVYAMSLNTELTFQITDYYGSIGYASIIPNSMGKITSKQPSAFNYATSQFSFYTTNITDILDVVVYQPQLNLGSTLYPYSTPAGLPQSLTDYTGHANNAVLGSTSGADTNDPKFNGVALVGDGVDDYAVVSLASAAYRISVVDSGSGYVVVDEVPAYLNLFKTGASTYLNGKIGPTAYYNRVPTASEIVQAKRYFKRLMAGRGVTVS